MVLEIPRKVLNIINPSKNTFPFNNLGIYVHFPFCIKECFYCDFYKTVNFKRSLYDEILHGLVKIYEYLLSMGYSFGVVDSLYFGGGTPNLMSLKFIDKILGEINKFFKLGNNMEISFEVNPGSISLDYLRALKNLGINRISCGVQSFNLFALRIMGRTHSVNDIFKTVSYIEKFFENYNLDLLALYPYQDIDSLRDDLRNVLSINPPHLSYYLMDIDKGVNYPEGMIKKIKINYEKAGSYYTIIRDYLVPKYVHYEISNFSLDGYYCRHNLKYWYYFDYVGIGPSAVSKITIKDNVYRFKLLPNIDLEIEEIDKDKQLMERLMLSLRTRWGIIAKYQNTKKVFKIKNFENYNSEVIKYV